jgi:NAD(P)-dependent dehydrogenase (short-subunit alcohol dehydrogenase family)
VTRLAGKVALITGAGSGIGRSAAVRFAAEGAKVGITDLDKANLDETAAQVATEVPGADVFSVSGDILDRATIDALASLAVERFGQLDVLFNNVGILILKSLLETTDEDFDRLLHVNCLSHLIAIQRVVPEMRKLKRAGEVGGAGSVINVASIGALVALPNVSAYGASKSAVIGLTRTAAVEFAPEIRVNVICPGGVATPMAERHLESFEDKEAAMKLLTGRQLIKRYARPEEIANVAAFLASDEASFMTGAVIPVEAGHSAWLWRSGRRIRSSRRWSTPTGSRCSGRTGSGSRRLTGSAALPPR